MIEQKKHSSQPGVIGCFMSVLLIVSFFLPRIWQDNSTVESFNTVLIVVIMCLAVHLVRKTSSLFYDHVWNNLGFTILLIIPVINLIITACQFIWGTHAFMQHPLFTALLILISLPAFCCYFFTVIWLYCKRNKTLMISSTLLDAFGLIYILIRLADRSFLPLAVNAGHEVAVFIERLFSVSPYFSLIIYILAFFNYIICARLFGVSAKSSDILTNKNI